MKTSQVMDEDVEKFMSINLSLHLIVELPTDNLAESDDDSIDSLLVTKL